ncbi:Zn-dependent hydrolase [Sporosarcina gallistercoris]|uniref:Zn-dependent hydrolase n=1 Tax=Sporosarcina gallistercoris TaxID=2762245 RepID=A0ABR8PLK6_9BACL|nr:Zn-dependent hydrolase [Sporosarcina gallistercoris]MBD7909051.1 Zn-dependent hydrolase [Sporosarcina gallistercoris]
MTATESLFTKLTAGYDESLSRGGVDGGRIAQRLSELSMIGASPEGGVTRPGYSPEEKHAKQVVKSWMEQAGLQVFEDGAGNVIGRLEGMESGNAIMSGSHVDSVPNGGDFDGPLGVIAALEVAEAWKETGYHPRKAYEVVIFSDEEGTRFGAGLTGSHAMTGQLTEEETNLKVDKEGKSFETVIEEYGSSLPAVWRAKRNMGEIELFVELHIEQGKLLEKNGCSVGAVKGIAGPVWMNVTFEGEAGHAGNTPMDDRRDSMVAAGHFIHTVSSLPRQFSETSVATIGKLNVFPNGLNVIPQKVELTVDIRDIHEDPRDALVQAIIEAAEQSGVDHNVGVTCRKTLAVQPMLVNEELLSDLKESISEFGMEPMELMSGAGHDAMVIGREVPAAMLFVQSKKGISHNPEEWTDLSDCVIGVQVLKNFIEKQMERS